MVTFITRDEIASHAVALRSSFVGSLTQSR
jgi:hypothetical protein